MKKVAISLPADLHMWLAVWAYLRESDLQGWMKTVLRLRVNHHKESMLAELDQRAETMGISRDELLAAICSQAQVDVQAMREELGLTR